MVRAMTFIVHFVQRFKREKKFALQMLLFGAQSGGGRVESKSGSEPGHIPHKSGVLLNDDDVQLCMGKNINQRKTKTAKKAQNVR